MKNSRCLYVAALVLASLVSTALPGSPLPSRRNEIVEVPVPAEARPLAQ